jgi:cyclic pyranopterin phosphate synthase
MARGVSSKKLSHVDAAGKPRMVDVSAKRVTHRVARAECRVLFPTAMAKALHAKGLRSKKGPVLDTAMIAGTQAVKRTHELIPFCHPLPIERCTFDLRFLDEQTLSIECEVAVRARTGVEMEALTGVTVAALTVYDMCKSLGHDMQIGPARVLDKCGGKTTLKRRKA